MSVIKDKNYQIFLSSTTVSALGSFAFNFAFMSYLYFATGNDKRFIALSQLFFVIGMLLGNLSGGAIAEKIDRKKLLLYCELIRIPVVATMLFFSDSIWPLLFLHGTKTYFAGISTPLKRTFIHDTTAPKDVPTANMLFTISYSITQIIGPLVGTWCYFYYKDIKVLIVLDLITFAISSLLMFALKYDVKTKLNDKKVKFFIDIKEGFKYITKNGHVLSLFKKHIMVGLISGLLLPLILPFIVEVLKATEKEYGVFMVVFGVGGILGAVFSKKIGDKIGTGKVIALICLVEPIILYFWARGFSLGFCILIFAGWGSLFFLRVTLQFNYISKFIDETFLSRTNALFDFVFTLTSITATTVISLSGRDFSTKTALTYAAFIYGAFVIIDFMSKDNKHFMEKKEL
jgi:predicted MFS family arabinose efflux permease